MSEPTVFIGTLKATSPARHIPALMALAVTAPCAKCGRETLFQKATLETVSAAAALAKRELFLLCGECGARLMAARDCIVAVAPQEPEVRAAKRQHDAEKN